MSHPHKPRVSPNSGAAYALSNAGDTHEQPADQTDNGADTAQGSASPLLAQARQWYQQSGLPDTLSQVPEPLKRLAGQTAGRWRQLSTTQKVVGGALIAAGGWYLLSRAGQSDARTSRRTEPTGTVHELLLFVNDRIEGYQRAVAESQDAELRGYYKQLVSQSQQFASHLNAHLREQGDEQETGTTLKGKLYRGWMDVKAAFTARDEKAILGSNVYGEEWALKAYEDALSNPELPGKLRQEIQHQYEQSQKTYQKLQKLEGQQS
jgi:uncharacterized protein (TIGR02284 family)